MNLRLRVQHTDRSPFHLYQDPLSPGALSELRASATRTYTDVAAYRDNVVAFKKQGSTQVFGNGMFLTPHYILTARHVLFADDAFRLTNRAPALLYAEGDFQRQHRLNTWVYCAKEKNDLALVAVHNAHASVRPVSFGGTNVHDKLIVVARHDDGLKIRDTAVVTVPDNASPDCLTCPNSIRAEVQLQHGYSGCPILHSSTGRYAAMAQWATQTGQGGGVNGAQIAKFIKEGVAWLRMRAALNAYYSTQMP